MNPVFYTIDLKAMSLNCLGTMSLHRCTVKVCYVLAWQACLIIKTETQEQSLHCGF